MKKQPLRHLQAVKMPSAKDPLANSPGACIARLTPPEPVLRPVDTDAPRRRGKPKKQAKKKTPKLRVHKPPPGARHTVALAAPLSRIALHMVARHLMRIEYQVAWSSRMSEVRVYQRLMLGPVRCAVRVLRRIDLLSWAPLPDARADNLSAVGASARRMQRCFGADHRCCVALQLFLLVDCGVFGALARGCWLSLRDAFGNWRSFVVRVLTAP
jgi:hypothetical protein